MAKVRFEIVERCGSWLIERNGEMATGRAYESKAKAIRAFDKFNKECFNGNAEREES